MPERQILHTRFLLFFKFLEEQGDLSRDEKSKSFNDLVTFMDIDKKLLSAYLKSEHFITYLQAYKFCDHFNLNKEEMFADMTNYIEKIALENDLTIDTEINAIGGYALPITENREIGFKKIQGLRGGTFIFNVTGNSMSPQYNDGEKVITEKLNSFLDVVDSFTYVFCMDDGSHRIKKGLKCFDENRELSGFIFLSNNPKFKQDFCPLNDIKTIYRILQKYPLSENKSNGDIGIIKPEVKLKKVKDLISEGHIKKVLMHLRELAPNNNDLIVFQSQLTQNQREYRKGEIEISSRDKSNARIISGILEYLDDLTEKELDKIDLYTFEQF